MHKVLCFSKLLLVISFIFVLSGCSNLRILKEIDKAQHGRYNNALANMYLTFAKDESANMDWGSSSYFARKGIAVANGERVLPETINRWGIPDEKAKELIWARERVLNLLTDDVKLEHPEQAAKIMYLYDCWVENQSEIWQTKEIEKCRMNFMLEASNLDQKLLASPPTGNPIAKTPPIPEVVEITQSEETKPENDIKTDVAQADMPESMPNQEDKSNDAMQEEEEEESSTFIVFFDFDSASIDDVAKTVIDDVLNEVKDAKDYMIKLAGHTDTSGPKAYNMELSKHRTNSVATHLEENGISKGSIDKKWYGETMPAIKTEDGVKLRKNRRVEINIEGL